MSKGFNNINQVKQVSRWTLQPITDIFRSKIPRKPIISLESVASNVWEVSPASTRVEPKAYFLPNQCERITSWVFTTDNWRERIRGGILSHNGPTRHILLKDAWLIDGVLYKDGANSYLHPRLNRIPQISVNYELEKAALYCTPGGNQYFGVWLMDDCVSYLLAANHGVPVTTNLVAGRHQVSYEKILDMHPLRVSGAYFKELSIFDDVGQNESKHQRFRLLGRKLLSGIDVKPHPGVFILRGKTGVARVLENEAEIAEYLSVKRGFRVLDPMKEDVETIIRQCAGAETIVGVEGSQLFHGLMVLPIGGSVMTIQPPDRFCTLIKDLTDRDNQHFGFVVGHKTEHGFTADIDEIERTIDIMPKLY
ncbi:MAG: glycosyltransferase 61 family protein [Methylophilus sp.]